MAKMNVNDLFATADMLREYMGRKVELAPSVGLDFVRLAKVVEKEIESVVELEKQILRDAGALEDDNGFVPRTDPETGEEIPDSICFDPPENNRVAGKKRQELYQSELEFNAPTLSIKKLEKANAKLSTADLYALAPFIKEMQDAEDL